MMHKTGFARAVKEIAENYCYA